nr:hypothetical protein CFP56_09466 [Quercus suber]
MSSSSSVNVVLGPLTTVFTSPAFCLGNVAVATYPVDPYVWAFPNQQCVDETDFYFATKCWPSLSFPVLVDMGLSVAKWGYYSPGIACPSGYYSAGSATASGSSNFVPTYSITMGETAVGCCPESYTLAHGQCRSSASTIHSGRTCVNSTFTDFATEAVPTLVTATFHSEPYTTAVSSAVYIADYIEIRWQSSDRLSTITPTAISSATMSPAPAATSTAVMSTSTSSPSAAAISPTPQSIDAKIAIATVVPLALLAVCAVLSFYWQRRSSKGKQASDIYDSSRELHHDHAMPKVDHPDARYATGRLPGYHELAEQRWPQELGTKQVLPHERHELAA